jgi:hypothetical protein
LLLVRNAYVISEGELIEDLAVLRALYECNIQSVGGLCSLISESEPSAMDYNPWLSAEVTGLPDVFAGVNENFISIAVEGTLMMAGDSVHLATLQTLLSTAGRTFCPPSGMYDESRALCQKNGGAPSATIMC